MHLALQNGIWLWMLIIDSSLCGPGQWHNVIIEVVYRSGWLCLPGKMNTIPWHRQRGTLKMSILNLLSRVYNTIKYRPVWVCIPFCLCLSDLNGKYIVKMILHDVQVRLLSRAHI